MTQKDDDDFDENGVLKDGRSYRVPLKMCDSMQRSIAKHFQHRSIVTAADGSTMGLHRPGARIASGGNRAVRDALAAEAQRARDQYEYDLVNAWRKPHNVTDDADTEARAGAIRNALLSRGHDPSDVEEYLNSIEDDDLLDGDLGDHVQAFENGNNGRDAKSVAIHHKLRLDELYRQRDAELANQWRKGK
jgi:hypothetical protein